MEPAFGRQEYRIAVLVVEGGATWVPPQWGPPLTGGNMRCPRFSGQGIQ